jgi:hypothetical protein
MKCQLQRYQRETGHNRSNDFTVEAPVLRSWHSRLSQRPSGAAAQELTLQFRAKVLAKTQQSPPDGSTHWSLRKMAALMGVSKDLIRQVWREADLKPIGWIATWPATT